MAWPTLPGCSITHWRSTMNLPACTCGTYRSGANSETK
jgi:hypothetical protein